MATAATTDADDVDHGGVFVDGERLRDSVDE